MLAERCNATFMSSAKGARGSLENRAKCARGGAKSEGMQSPAKKRSSEACGARRVRFCHHGGIGFKADVKWARAPGPSPGAPALAAGSVCCGGGLERAAGHPGCHGGWSNGVLLAAHHHAAQACRCRCAWAGLCGPRTLWCGASGPPWLLARLGFGFVAARLLALALGAVGVALARPPRSAAFRSLPQRKIRSWVLRNRNSCPRPSCHRRR